VIDVRPDSRNRFGGAGSGGDDGMLEQPAADLLVLDARWPPEAARHASLILALFIACIQGI
jgi:hypothetical protein